MILTISGYSGSGKSTAAEMLLSMNPRARLVAFADPLKEMVQPIFLFSNEQLYGPSNLRSDKSTICDVTPRQALQTLGTWGRDLWPDIWANLALRRIEGLKSVGFTHFVIPDQRYKNELQLLKRHGAWTMRIKRAGVDRPAFDHSSETEMSSIYDAEFDFVVDAEEGLDKFYQQMEKWAYNYGWRKA